MNGDTYSSRGKAVLSKDAPNVIADLNFADPGRSRDFYVRTHLEVSEQF
jgi:hypothetical protein